MCLLLGLIGFCFVLLAPVAYWSGGGFGVAELSVAALLSLVSGAAALGAMYQMQRIQQPLLGMLLAMAIRMTPPLILCLGLAVSGRGNEFFGFICYLLVFFLVSLAIETYLSVQLANSHA